MAGPQKGLKLKIVLRARPGREKELRAGPGRAVKYSHFTISTPYYTGIRALTSIYNVQQAYRSIIEFTQCTASTETYYQLGAFCHLETVIISYGQMIHDIRKWIVVYTQQYDIPHMVVNHFLILKLIIVLSQSGN